MGVGRRPLLARPPSSIPTFPWPEPEPSPHHAVSVPDLLPISPLRLDLRSPLSDTHPPPPPLDSLPPAGRPSWVLGLSCAMDDGGGEQPHLPRKKGKTKRPPSSAAPPPPAERGRGRDRFESLWRDYHDLLQETDAKKRRLERINRRKLGLLAEVKFLRKKFSSFVNDDQQTQHTLKNKTARQFPSTLGMNEGPSTSKGTNVDLNQDSAMNGERVGRQGNQDHSEPGKHDLVGIDEDIMNSNVNLSGYRDTGNSPASEDMRATAWQDRVALRI